MIVCIHCGRELAPDAPGSACRCALAEPSRAIIAPSRSVRGGSASAFGSQLEEAVSIARRLAASRGGRLTDRDLRVAALKVRKGEA